METQKCCGILLAQNCGIANRENYEIHVYQGNICLYLHRVKHTPEFIKAAVDIIDHLHKNLSIAKEANEDVVIDLEFLQQLNKEYQTFVQQKLTQIKMVRDHSQKMISHIEDMKMPQIEIWFNKYFSQNLSSKDNQCKYCGFEAKNSAGLVSHMRACKKKPAQEDDSCPLPMPLPPPKPQKLTTIEIVPKKE